MASDKAQNILTYEEVRKLKDDANYLLVDVREPSELAVEGSIPGSINIPHELEKTLSQLSPVDFQNKFKREKPAKDFNIIFSCKSGRRSGMALDKARALGYCNTYNYLGSWLDWAKNTK